MEESYNYSISKSTFSRKKIICILVVLLLIIAQLSFNNQDISAEEINIEGSIKELEIIAERTKDGSIPSFYDMATLQHFLLESNKELSIKQNITILRLVVQIATFVALVLNKKPKILISAIDLDHYLKTLIDFIGIVDDLGYIQYKRNRILGLYNGPKDYIYSYEDRVQKWELKYQYETIVDLLRTNRNKYYGIDVSYRFITEYTRFRDDWEWSFKITNYGKDLEICSFVVLLPNFPSKILLEEAILNKKYESLLKRHEIERGLIPEGWTVRYGEGFIEFKAENQEELLDYNKELTFTIITDDDHTDLGLITILANTDLNSALCHSITDDNGYASSITGIIGPMLRSDEDTYDTCYSDHDIKSLKGCARIIARNSAERDSKFIRKLKEIPKDNQLNFVIFDLSLYVINNHYYANDMFSTMAIEVLTFLEHYASNQAKDEIIQAYIDSYYRSFENEGFKISNP